MKKTSLFLSLCSLVVAVAALVITLKPAAKEATTETPVENTSEGSTKGIAFFNLDEVVSKYQFAIDEQAKFENKAKGIDEELNRRRVKIEDEDKTLAEQLSKGLIIRSQAEVKYQDLQKKVGEFQNYGQQKQAELAEEQQVLLNNIANQIMEYVKVYNATAKYDIILSTQGNLLPSPVVLGSDAINITYDLIAGLNAKYQAEKSKK